MPQPKSYSAKSPCPICGRYKTAYKNKCYGFITTGEGYAYCSREVSDGPTALRFGQKLYRHPLSGLVETPLNKEANTPIPLRHISVSKESELVPPSNSKLNTILTIAAKNAGDCRRLDQNKTPEGWDQKREERRLEIILLSRKAWPPQRQKSLPRGET